MFWKKTIQKMKPMPMIRSSSSDFSTSSLLKGIKSSLKESGRGRKMNSFFLYRRKEWAGKKFPHKWKFKAGKIVHEDGSVSKRRGKSGQKNFNRPSDSALKLRVRNGKILPFKSGKDLELTYAILLVCFEIITIISSSQALRGGSGVKKRTRKWWN